MIFFLIFLIFSASFIIIKYVTLFWACIGVIGSAIYAVLYTINNMILSVKSLIATELLSSKKGKFSEIIIDNFTLYKKDDSFIISRKNDEDKEQIFVDFKDTTKTDSKNK